MADQDQDQGQDQGLTTQVGPLEINWPLTVGYYGGIGLAVATEMIAPPLALFIAAVPFFQMLNHPGASRPTRLVAQLLKGAATPVNGDAPGSIRLTTPDVASAARQVTPNAPERRPRSIWAEARQLADRARAGSPDAPAADAGQG